MRVLLVEDNAAIRTALAATLRNANFAVDTSDNGEEGLFLALTNAYDCILLDDGLPRKTGRAVCEELRADGNQTPVIMITVRSEPYRKVELLDLGADDYVTKPFAAEEVAARVRALLRRPATVQASTLVCDDLCLDTTNHTVTRGGTAIYLTRKEFMLLEYLLRNRGTLLGRQQILEHVWDGGADPFSNTIETHILKLRKKIDARFSRKLIHTVPGCGYKLDVA